MNWTLRRQNGFLAGQPSRKLSKWKQGLFKTKFIIIWETEFSTGAGRAALFRCPYLRKTRISKSAPSEIISTLLRVAMRIRSVLILNSHQRTSPNGNDNHNKQASCFIFSPFEAIFASSKFYKVARIYWVVASGKLSHRVHLDLFNHVNLFTRKQYCWIHFWNRILAFIQYFHSNPSPPKTIPDIFWILDILLKPSWQKYEKDFRKVFKPIEYLPK